MTVPDFVMEKGNISEGKTPNNDHVSQRTQYLRRVHVSFKNLSRLFARYLREVNYRIRDKIYTWWVRVAACWISIPLWYCYYSGVTYVPQRHLGEVSSWRVAWNTRLYYVVSYLEIWVQVVNARHFKDCPVFHNWRLLLIHALISTFGQCLFPFTFSVKEFRF